MSDARDPAFDHDGQYLYFTASTNYGPTPAARHDQRRARGHPQCLSRSCCRIISPSPLAPESDEEKPAEPQARRVEDAAVAEAPPKPVRIDFDKIDAAHRRAADSGSRLSRLDAGHAGVLYLLEASSPADASAAGDTLSKFDLKTRKIEIARRARQRLRPFRQRRKNAAPHSPPARAREARWSATRRRRTT